jgi:hypothetical protein
MPNNLQYPKEPERYSYKDYYFSDFIGEGKSLTKIQKELNVAPENILIVEKGPLYCFRVLYENENYEELKAKYEVEFREYFLNITSKLDNL